jgi:hypothetical protein
MLLRNRPPRIDERPAITTQGFEHLPHTAIAVIRWLNANRIDYVLVGPVARAIRGDAATEGPVAIVPAPYGRNLDRLSRALDAANARLRLDGDPAGPGADATQPVKITAERLVRAERWTLRCGSHDLDVEGRFEGAPRYQELLYESSRFELASEVSVEVAAPEDIEHYDHVRRTGTSPEMKVTRVVREPDVPELD